MTSLNVLPERVYPVPFSQMKSHIFLQGTMHGVEQAEVQVQVQSPIWLQESHLQKNKHTQSTMETVLLVLKILKNLFQYGFRTSYFFLF